MTKKKKKVRKKLKVRTRPTDEFDCFCTCCGHKWTVNRAQYDLFRSFGCEECDSIYYEIDHPHFPDSLADRLKKLGLPINLEKPLEI